MKDGTEIGLATNPASLSTALRHYHRWYDPSIYNLIGLARLLEHDWKVEKIDEDHVLLSKGVDTKVKCRLNKGTDISLLAEIFVRKVYGEEFRGKTILDVGAYNGDSAILFAKGGAGLVIGLEPDPQNYKLAVENLRLNKLEDRVKLFNLALSTAPGESHFAVNSTTPNISRLEELSATDSSTLSVATTSVKEIVDYLGYLGLRRIDLLKMNCEGCEYGVISNLPPDILGSLQEIILEFHDGPRDMPHILAKHGFRTEIKGGTFGYIRAFRANREREPIKSQLRVESDEQGPIVAS
ncbi:FkbM family methyltransferase [Candidatus Bathyarchaeota archaeon]|nr:FkbM family methyltransferase [Candidatus Bathyarchaeota archaeon]